MPHNGLRAGDRNPVLRLRQGYGACTLLAAEQYHAFKNPNSYTIGFSFSVSDLYASS